MAEPVSENHHIIYNTIGKALSYTATSLLIIESLLGSIAIDLALCVMLADSASNAKDSGFLTGYLLHSLFSLRYERISDDSILSFGSFSILNSLIAGIILGIYFQNIQIPLVIGLIWAVSIGLYALGEFLQSQFPSEQKQSQSQSQIPHTQTLS